MTEELSAEDVLEIRELFALWSILEDAGRADAWADLFTVDGQTTNSRGAVYIGHEALAADA